MVEEAGSGVAERESVNEYREKMMSKAIARVCTLTRDVYEKKVRVHIVAFEQLRTLNASLAKNTLLYFQSFRF